MSKRDQLGASSSFARASQARSVRRQLTDAAFGGDPTVLDLALISGNPDNPREALGDVSGMASSLLEVGQIQAITVASVEAYLRDRPERASELEPGAEYVVIDGHRRLAGAKEANLTSIKVTVDDARVSTDEVLLESAFVANAQRENLSDLEEAQALKTLVKFYGSQHKAAKRLGVSQPYISQRLSLLELEPQLQADLEAGLRKVEHVRGLGKLSPAEQRATADARARQAQENRQRRNPPASPAAPLNAGGNAATTNEQINRFGTEQPNSDNGVIAGSSLDNSAEAGPHTDYGVIDGHLVASTERPDTAPAAADRDGANAASSLPWHNPQALNRLARQHMSHEDRQTLAKLLTED
ncbi:ParB/RepB/Spo0J family partition protein [Streptomyces sp. CB02261]|uniref:ParB/RepB/Spo0J family partition protein n=1 Tax=Streptomyces sp. CB02261 TaxID=1703940 RepID=UPI00093CBD59|nr:ParB/RepB/Spo0J family partition protein [Streptomyces sp. CB02261]